MPRTDEERARAADRAAPFINAIRTAINSYGVDRSGVTAVENPNRPVGVKVPVTGFMNPTKYGAGEIAPAPAATASTPVNIVVPAEDRQNTIPVSTVTAAVPTTRRIATAPQPEQLSGPAGPSEVKPLHERFATPREAYRGMSDTEFKRFVDEHKHIPGIGYVENEKGKIERIIPPSEQATRGRVIEDMNAEQIHAMTGLLNVQHQAKAAALSEARLGLEGKRAEREDRRLDLTEKRYDEMSKLDREKFAFDVDKFDKAGSLKEPMNYVKALEMFSPDEVDEVGTKTGKKNYQAGGEALSAMGYPVPKGMKIPQTTVKIPQQGDVVKGYKFKGGNPADKNSWEKI